MEETPPIEISTPKDYNGFNEGRYRFLDQIGRGAYSKVFKIVNIETCNQLACKMILKSSLDEQVKMQKFTDEMSVHCKLRHPSIVQSYFILEDDRNYYLFMDYCQEGNLHNLINRRGKLTEIQSAIYLYEILSGLEFLHERDIIHRDIKAENLYIDSGKIKIGDFGFAIKLKNKYELRKTMCGSTFYMAPDIFESIKTDGYGKEVDMWSVGVLTYLMLTKSFPFYAKTQIDIIKLVLEGKFEKPKDISNNAIDFINRLLISRHYRIKVNDAIQHNFIQDNLPGELRLKSNLTQIDDLMFEKLS